MYVLNHVDINSNCHHYVTNGFNHRLDGGCDDLPYIKCFFL